MRLESIKEPVKDSFQAVDKLVVDSLHSKASIINDLGKYIIQSGGKRLRPLIVLLVARACGYQGNEHITLATVIEFIHTATLLHDDVVDASSHRRGQQTANNVWGNEAAVLVGDFLYSKAFQMLVSVANKSMMRVLADATNTMAEGEALQLLERHNAEMTENGYLNVIRSKTAKLFEASAQIGAILGQADEELEQAMAQFGIHLGTAFQLIDDLLDYQSSPLKTGKSIGNDLAQGKVTLPIIYLLQNGKADEIQQIRQAIQEGGYEHLPLIQNMLEKSGAIEYTQRFAQAEIKRAKEALSKLTPSPYQDSLQLLTQFAIERDN
jgi:octaprenyl-diphosphate synthase